MIRVTMNKSAFVLLIISCVFMLTTCQFKGCDKENTSAVETRDTLFLNQWKREKAEKLKLVDDYKLAMGKLQSSKDSLLIVVDSKKKSIASLNFKTAHYEDLLRERLVSNDTLDKGGAISLLDSLVKNQNENDTACSQAIQTLEMVVANRDSVIVYHEKTELALEQIQKNNEVEISFLTAQLNDDKRLLRRKTRQNKFLSAGLVLLTGITSSILITQQLK